MVIAVCTSHERSKIENCGAHFVVDNMEQVRFVNSLCLISFHDGALNVNNSFRFLIVLASLTRYSYPSQTVEDC
ncbi:hypothetical protein F5880DRAFT_1576945 [Lentinula raphanica]|nr:hypothetical protein F5880DRAFT_1576945 [Lentinula raphanica]